MGKKNKRFSGNKVDFGTFMGGTEVSNDTPVQQTRGYPDKKQSNNSPVPYQWRAPGQDAAATVSETMAGPSSNNNRTENKPSSRGSQQRRSTYENQQPSPESRRKSAACPIGADWRELNASNEGASGHQKETKSERGQGRDHDRSDTTGYKYKQKYEEHVSAPEDSWRVTDSNSEKPNLGHDRAENKQKNEEYSGNQKWRTEGKSNPETEEQGRVPNRSDNWFGNQNRRRNDDRRGSFGRNDNYVSQNKSRNEEGHGSFDNSRNKPDYQNRQRHRDDYYRRTDHQNRSRNEGRNKNTSDDQGSLRNEDYLKSMDRRSDHQNKPRNEDASINKSHDRNRSRNEKISDDQDESRNEDGTKSNDSKFDYQNRSRNKVRNENTSDDQDRSKNKDGYKSNDSKSDYQNRPRNEVRNENTSDDKDRSRNGYGWKSNDKRTDYQNKSRNEGRNENTLADQDRSRDELGSESSGRRGNEVDRQNRPTHIHKPGSFGRNFASNSSAGYEGTPTERRNIFTQYSENYKEFLGWSNAKDSKEKKSTIRELKGDLFSAPSDFSLCHCVAEDLYMASGIAVAFRAKFKRVDELMDQRVKTGGVAILQDEGRFLYYLVTKQLSRGKPTNATLLESLLKMKEHMLLNEVTKLAMPTIGCGLDRLSWDVVSKMIEFVFRDVEVQIVVYIFEQKDEVDDNAGKNERKAAKIFNRDHPLVDIESETILTFIASIDHTPTVQINELDKKFYFLPDYQQDKNAKLGDNFYITKKNESIVGLYVKEKENDPFSFKNFVLCLKKLNNYFKKGNLFCIGIEAIAEENDELIMSKLNTLLRVYVAAGYEVYICGRKLE